MLLLGSIENWRFAYTQKVTPGLHYGGKKVVSGGCNGGDSMFVTDQSITQPGAVLTMTRDRFFRALTILTELHPPLENMTRAVKLFLMVADHHPTGITQAELVGVIDPDRQNISRWVKLLGDRPYVRTSAPSKSVHLGLIRATTSPHDLRTSVLTLTPFGLRTKLRIDRGE